jgi:hypothetical protein
VPERVSLCAEESIAAGAALYAQSGQERLLLDVLSGDVGVVFEGRPHVLASAGTPLPFSVRAIFTPTDSGKMEIPIFQSVDDMREEKTSLAVLELCAEAGQKIFLRCSLDVSGRMSFRARHGDAIVETPLLSGEEPLSLTRKAGAAASPAEADKIDKAGKAGKISKMRALKMRLMPIEPSLDETQHERLHAMVQRLENLEDDAESVEILDGVVKDLEKTLS